MTNRFILLLTLFMTIALWNGLHAQVQTDKSLLLKMAGEFKAKEELDLQRALAMAKQKGWFLQRHTPNGGLIKLIGVDDLGNPKYVSTFDNIIAAATTKANQLWPGGSSGLNLSGSSAAVKGKLAIWDGGHALTTHVELVGRITLGDVADVEGHPTHTSGTLIATGINPIAKGMAFGAQQLLAYDFSNDEAEMAQASPNLLLSNHSYGYLPGSGWTFDGTNWDWYGDTTISKTLAYGFGYYSIDAQIYDSIAYHAPQYLICIAAGNARGYNGPPVDSPYLYNGGSTLYRNATLANNPNFTSVSNAAESKNTLVVGAVNGIPAGYSSPSDVVIADFSSLGPSNDGRIKPDVVADGVNVTSSWNTSNTAYSTQSGTSMATPNTTGSLYLLQEYYNQLHPSNFMRAATLRGLAIHTADQTGNSPGPNYTFGWGLVDVLKGANVITSSYKQETDTIIESTLTSGVAYTFQFVASGKGQVVATMAWTDPPGTAVAVSQALNNTTPMLVNDLDMRITNGTKTFMPWVLNPSNPSAPATTGDNFRDNVEKITIDSLVPGQTYTLTVTNKGTLARGPQAFSLLVSGIGGNAYCTSAPTSSSGTRIDSVEFSNIQVANPAGCTTYINNTADYAEVQPNEKLPIRILLGTCDTPTNNIIKVYIDLNNNGVFDSSDLVAESGIVPSGGVFADSISIPLMTVGNTTLMRIVAVQTTDSNAVQPCGSYGNGETDDYSVYVNPPSHDVALASIISPAPGDCGDDSERVVISIRNNGIDAVSNLPVTAQVNIGSSTVATFTETYPGQIPPGFTRTYTFQELFPVDPATTYTVVAYVKAPLDQVPSNDTFTVSVLTSAKPADPVATATVNGDSVTLNVTSPNPNSSYFWYSSASSTTPLFSASDTTVSLSTLPSGNNYYLGSGAKGYVGVASKEDYQGGTDGGYQTPGGNFMAYNAAVPVVLENARLYTGNPGKVQIMVWDTTDTQPDGSFYYYVLSSTVVDVYATNPFPKAGSYSGNSPLDTGAIFYINLPLPAGNHLLVDSVVDPTVDSSAVAAASIFRNNNVTGDPYPFTIPGVISFYSNSATSSTNPTLFQSYYYYQYHMFIHTDDCISDRVAIPVSVPNISIFTYGPNPVIRGEPLNILFNAGNDNNIEIELYDMLGRRCYLQSTSGSGLFGAQIPTNNLGVGMYILSVNAGSAVYRKKIIVTK